MQLAPKDICPARTAALGQPTRSIRPEQYTRWLATSHYENFHVVSVPAAQAPASGFLQCLRVLPLGRRFGRRDRRSRRRACGCWPGGAANWTPCIAGKSSILCSWRCKARSQAARSADRAVRRSDHRLRAGSDRHALPELGRAVRLLPQLRESGGTAGAAAVRLRGSRTRPPVGCHLHRACSSRISGRT